MNYDQFVEKYCDGLVPTAHQRNVIIAWLDYPKGQLLWLSGRQSGQAVMRSWLRKALYDITRTYEETNIADIDARQEYP